ncbi:hypothetical protein RVR_P1101 (plasmid) [Actinacidiphila reveromycinica]|uniref:Uncharacterized protein n=1 Tax=Actinacidiphila reveromycinica TaxID=659352 RepID=A0A7R6QCM8_9ACTN|nr:hypothetical protein [Streptomyces sp. SN-593]BBG20718.1 hypothetical protein RVR_P1101 [Streptomyces sp. SN-593]
MDTADDRSAILRYDQLTARVYGEHRMPPGTRDLILALGWVTLRDPRRHDPTVTTWARTREVLNADNATMSRLIGGDAPRYEPDWNAGPHGCQAPMVRVDRLCGRSTSVSFAEFDPVTGWLTPWGFCSRPRCQEYMRPIAERADGSKAKAPEPIPNTGGLLPIFFASDWERRYFKAAETRVLPGLIGWTPPPYGLSADEWPEVPGEHRPAAFPKLRLIAADGEIVLRSGPALVPAGDA